jgi:Zn-dependent protease
MKFSKIEKEDLLKAWLMISLAFAIVMGGFSISTKFVVQLLVSSLTVGMGFLLHELGHKYVAQKFGCFAEFRADMKMLFLAVAMSFMGFIFVAPGAVYIMGKHMTIKKNGLISAAGPLVNIGLAITFLMLASVGYNNVLISYGFMINTWLGLFNMIPFMPFDGAKILKWNKVIYGSMVAGFLLLMNINAIL